MNYMLFRTSFATPRNGGEMLGSVSVCTDDKSPGSLIIYIPTWELQQSDARDYEIKIAEALPNEQRLNYIELGLVTKVGEERGAPIEHWDVLEVQVDKDVPILNKFWNTRYLGASATQSAAGKFIITIVLYAGRPNSLIPMLVNRHDFDLHESASLFSLFAHAIDEERRRGMGYRN